VERYNWTTDDSLIAGFAYDYDAACNRTGVLESGGDRVTWTYDATDRLTREQRSGSSAYDNNQFGLADDVRFVRQPAGSGLTWHSDSRESLWMLTSRSFRVLVLTNGL
jgi:YD repeat-containing protein